MDIRALQDHFYLQTAVSATALAIGAGLLAIPYTARAANGDLSALCGTTVTTNLTVNDAHDNYAGSCHIDIADGASLTIKNSSLEATEDIDFDAFGTGRLTLKSTELDAGDDIRIETEWGLIDVQPGSSIEADGHVHLLSQHADVVVTNSGLFSSDSEDVRVEGANVSIKGSELFTRDDLFVTASGLLNFLDNMVTTRGCEGTSVSLMGYSNITVVGNDFDIADSCSDARLLVASEAGWVTFKDNSGSIEAADDADLEITTGTGNISVQGNEIYFDGGSETVEIMSVSGNLSIKENDFTPAETLFANTGGKCTSVNNLPGEPCPL